MSVDQYSVCPCGSGKKIKFCKCKDSIHEMEKVLKMMSGGQMVAALDRLNQVLDEHPDAAWCLAVKGRLLMELGENDSLAENAERFMRLQPSNPLALTQQAASQGMRGDSQQAADSLLQALAESGNGVDTFVLDVASVLALSFAQSGNLASSRCFGGLALSASGYENNRIATMALEEVNRSRDVSAMLKNAPVLNVTPTDASVRERFDEAAALLKANQILLAESKFDSLARQHSGEEAVLRGLLVCATWRGDAQRQSDLLRKLSEIETLDIETRARDLAMSILIEPEQPQISTSAENISFGVEDVDLLEQTMLAASDVIRLPEEVIKMAGSHDENQVPPKCGFQWIDRDAPDGSELPKIDDAPIVLATALLYGKQTDRPARLELPTVCAADRERVMKFFQTLGGLSSDDPTCEATLVPLMGAATPNMPIMKISGTQNEANQLQRELVNRDFPTRLLETPMKVFGGKSAGEVKDDADLAVARTAIVRIVESYDVMSDTTVALDAIRSAMGVEALGPITVVDDEEIYSTPVDQMTRIDVEKLTNEQLFVLMNRAQAFHVTTLVQSTAARVIALDVPPEEEKNKLVAYMNLVDTTSDMEQSLEIIEKAKEWAKAKDVSRAPLLLSELGRRLSVQDPEGFQNCLQEITTDYANDQQVMMRLQQILVNFGLINPDGSPAGGGPPAPMGLGGDAGAAAAPPSPAGAGGIWTPDSPTPPPTPGKGESKLWVPGQD